MFWTFGLICKNVENVIYNTKYSFGTTSRILEFFLEFLCRWSTLVEKSQWNLRNALANISSPLEKG